MMVRKVGRLCKCELLPKKPASGLTAHSRPSFPILIHAMSSPTHSTFQPGSVEVSMAKLVLPHALGKAAAMYFFTPAGLVMPTMSMCSASQPSSLRHDAGYAQTRGTSCPAARCPRIRCRTTICGALRGSARSYAQ